jgi:hypothetical protein
LPPSRSSLNHYRPLVRFHKDEFYEVLCKLESTEYARSFKQNSPCLKAITR